MGDYQATYRRSIDEPEAFWAEAATALLWRTPPTRVLDDSASAVLPLVPRRRAQHLRERPRPPRGGRPRRPAALVYDSPVTGTQAHLHLRRAARRGGDLRRRAGAPWASARATGSSSTCRWCRRPWWRCWPARGSARCTRWCSAGSRPASSRPASTTPARGSSSSASCGIEVARVIEYKPLLDRALELSSHQPEHVVVLQRPQAVATLTGAAGPRLARAHRRGAEPAECVPVAATDPLYILYTSGTTAKPKGVVRDNGGHAVALRWSMANIYDVGPGDVWWTASDVGWVVGHSYIVYAPLLVGATTVLYEGKPVGTPDAGAFWRVVVRVRRAGAVHRADRVPGDQEGGPDGKLPGEVRRLARLRTLFLAGERLDPDTWEWATERLGVPVDRPLVADRDRLADRGEPARARADAHQARARRPCRCPGTTCRCSTRPAPPVARPAPRARSASGCRCRPARCRRCGATTSASSRRTSRRSTATTSPGTAGTSTRTATCSSWAAPTTSSTSPATGSRPGRWRP